MSTKPTTGPTPHADHSGDTVIQDEQAREQSRQLSRQAADAPRSLPGYEVLKCLGEGSFGSVWLMRELKTGKRVAVKFYSRRRGLDWPLLTREVEKLAVLYTSRNIVGLLDVGWNHDPPYFVMEYLESGSLSERLADGALPVAEAVRITRSLSVALVHAHGSGILHCDVKPANVLLDPTGEPRLGDFGQSRLTNEQSPALGTLFYMAPEQADLDAVPDARWDVYALGALLYHMLTGGPPYRDAANEERLRAAENLESRLTTYRELISESEPPVAHRGVAGVDSSLAAIVEGCLRRKPEQRFSNTQVVLDLLEQRDTRRAKRPLIALGFLGPIMFLLTMVWIATSVGRDVMKQAENSLVDQALAGDAVSAELLADSIDQELQNRRRVLEDLAARPQLAQLIRLAADETRSLDEEATVEKLRELHETADATDDVENPYSTLIGWKGLAEGRLAASNRTLDQSWFVTDASGRQIFRHPFQNAATIGDDFHWRDYFHGQGRELPESTDPSEVSPRSESGVSLAFRSQATGQYMVAIAVPVWDDERNEVIGVLARTIHLDKLLNYWERSIGGDVVATGAVHRFIALAEVQPAMSSGEPHRVQLLDHPWLNADNLSRFKTHDGRVSELQLDRLFTELEFRPEDAIALLDRNQTQSFRDPVGDPDFSGYDEQYGEEWLAAVARVSLGGGRNWLAIVQERKNRALAPVEELHDTFLVTGLWAGGVFSLLLLALWYLINRASA